MDSLKAMAPTPVDGQTPPSPIQALLGGISAGLIALILYKFATTVEAGLNRQTLSDNFSVCPFNSLITLFYSCVHSSHKLIHEEIITLIGVWNFVGDWYADNRRNRK